VQQLDWQAHQEKLPEARLRKRNSLVKLYGRKTGTKETSKLEQTLALAVGELERSEGLSEVAVLAQ
jgi:hypothetical protein